MKFLNNLNKIMINPQSVSTCWDLSVIRFIVKYVSFVFNYY